MRSQRWRFVGGLTRQVISRHKKALPQRIGSAAALNNADCCACYFFLGGTIASLQALATRNLTTVLAGILIS